MNQPATVHLDGQFREPRTCPKSEGGNCPACKQELHGHYGLMGGYGIGSIRLCINPDCDNDELYDFVADEGLALPP